VTARRISSLEVGTLRADGFLDSADGPDEGALGCGMDLGSVDRIQPLQPVEVRTGSDAVSPPLSPTGPARMDDDSYDEGGKERDRGLDDGDSEDQNQEEADSEDPAAGERQLGTQVNLFA